MISKTLIFVLAGVSLILVACGTIWQSSGAPLTDDAPNAANGEKIYFTGESQREGQISYSGGPVFGGMMMGSYLTCASCHGPEARGGTHVMHMNIMDAPDIRYVTMSAEEEHGDEGYNLEAFRRAVIEGQHPDGDELSPDMPRWKMSDADLEDLFEFLKSLP